MVNVSISKELQETVKKNPNIKKVYFDENDNHYFTKHEIELHEVDDYGNSLKVNKVQALPGAKRTIAKIILDKRTGKTKDVYVNTSYNPIAVEMTREQILSAKAVNKAMTDDEKLEILTKASLIAKDADFQELLKKLK
jgi:hypothetical protein